MRIVSRNILSDYWEKHAGTKTSLQRWIQVVSKAQWDAPSAVLESFRNAKILNGERVRFEISGGHRLIAAFYFPAQICWIKFIGTHAKYDAVDALEVDQFRKHKP